MANGVVVADAVRALREWLVASNFKPGARMPSERLIVAQLGIKHNTGNRAMTRLIAGGLIRREGYRLFYAGESKAPALDVFTCDLLISHNSRVLPSYRKIAKSLGIVLRVHYYNSVVDAVRLLHVFDRPETEGVVFDPPHLPASSVWEPAMIRLIRRSIPVVALRQHCEHAPCVAANYASAVQMAFTHLRELGHEEIALVATAPRSPASIEISAAWQSIKHQPGERAGPRRAAYYNDPREDIRAIAEKFSGPWKNVTAVIMNAHHEPIAPQFLEELARKKVHVPKDLSLICLDDFAHLASSVPPITTAAFDLALMQETMFNVVQRLARKKRETGIIQPATSLRAEPYLIVRESTLPRGAALQKNKAPQVELKTTTVEAEQDADPNSPDFKRSLKVALKRPYSLTATAEESRFKQIDLAPYVNRPLNFRKGWLGDLPLTQLGAGKHVIHGVPFEVLGGHSRMNCGALVFRSTTNETGSSKVLPSKLRIPIDAKARAIYVLHGCGYARHLARFATYEFYAGAKKLGAVPIVALGQVPSSRSESAKEEKDAPKANIQDWWPDFVHRDFLNARRAPLLEIDASDVVQSHVYLYTLEWKNPHPNLMVTHVEITADAGQSTTLGVVAISILKPPVSAAG